MNIESPEGADGRETPPSGLEGPVRALRRGPYRRYA